MANDNDSRLVNATRAAYQSRLRDLDVPAFTPPASGAAAAPDAGGFTLLARSRDTVELSRGLRPWLPGYLRRAGGREADADAFLAYILAHLGELGDRRFRDALPGWLAAFTGRAAALAPVPVDAAFAAAEAVDITLVEVGASEAPWTKTFRAHLRAQGVSSPAQLLAAPAPEALKDLPALPGYRRELYRSALRLHHEGLRLFEVAA